jgi:hypothetical protein
MESFQQDEFRDVAAMIVQAKKDLAVPVRQRFSALMTEDA